MACDAGAAEALVARLHARLAMEPRPGSEANRVLDRCVLTALCAPSTADATPRRSPSAPAEAAPSPRARAASAPRQLHHFFDDARAALPVTAGAARPRAPPSGSSRSGGGEPRSVSAAAWPTQPGPLPLVSALGLADVPALPSPTRRSPSPPPSPHRHSPPPPPEEEEEAPPPLPAPAVAQPGMRRFPSSAAAMAAAAAAAARDPVVAWSLPGDAEGWPSLGADEGGEAWGPDDAGGAGGAWAEEPFEDDGAAEGPPRRAGYTPYTQADYDRLTGPRAYWQLGRLGPDLEEPQLASKRAARARALAFAALAQASNTVRLAASPNRAPPVRMRSASPRARGR